jgi:hypothetical protein
MTWSILGPLLVTGALAIIAALAGEWYKRTKIKKPDREQAADLAKVISGVYEGLMEKQTELINTLRTDSVDNRAMITQLQSEVLDLKRERIDNEDLRQEVRELKRQVDHDKFKIVTLQKHSKQLSDLMRLAGMDVPTEPIFDDA